MPILINVISIHNSLKSLKKITRENIKFLTYLLQQNRSEH